MDAISLTVTPASEANSEENGGLRVDGLDLCTQPIPAGDLTATSGWIKWKTIFRHDDADAIKFGVTGNTPNILRAWNNAADYIHVIWIGANRIQFRFVVGGANTNGEWNPTLINEDIEYTFEIKYNATQAELIVNGVTQVTIVPGAGIDFGVNIPNIMYWGTNQIAERQADAVFIAP